MRHEATNRCGATRLLLAAVLLCPQLAWSIDCAHPTLKSATGVIGKEHRYKISGKCWQISQTTKTSAGSSTTSTTSIDFSYSGSARWDRLTGVATEKLSFTGHSTGQRHASATCSQDPFLIDPPGGAASCGPIQVQVEVKSGTTYQVLTEKTFWAFRGISLAEAQALSAQNPASQPPPPPAEKPKPKVPVASAGAVAQGSIASDQPAASAPPATGRLARRSPQQTAPVSAAAAGRVLQATLMEIEAEALVKANAVQVAGGQVTAQPMGGFGSAWSGGEQAFWHGGAVGAVLDLLVDVPVSSKYAVEIYFTRAPDYGQLKIEVDGKPSPVTFDGMAPQVVQTGPTQVGNFPLPAGKRRFSLMIVGKHPQSSGYYAGIDRIRLYPAGALD